MQRRALIFGITGMDGANLAGYLLGRGYQVFGVLRRASSISTARIDHIFDRLVLFHGDATDPASVQHAVRESRPHEVYYLAAQSHVKVSFEVPHYTLQVAMGVLHVLDAIRDHAPSARLYNASSSEMFGNEPAPQNEQTPLKPRSPYGVSKVMAHHLCTNYREGYGLHISNGILFNHCGPTRGETFVTRKITKAVARIKLGLQRRLVLGNLDASRDEGYSPDYVRAMWLMLQQDNPGDYVIATGESHTVREWCERAFSRVGLEWGEYVEVNERYFRPTEVNELRGDASKARHLLKWQPTIRFPELCDLMVDAELATEASRSTVRHPLKGC